MFISKNSFCHLFRHNETFALVDFMLKNKNVNEIDDFLHDVKINVQLTVINNVEYK